MGVSLLFPTVDNTWDRRGSDDFNPEFPVDVRVTPANTTSGSFVLFLAGPPRLITRYVGSDTNRDIEVVLYPFAYTDNLGIGNSKSQARIFGLGSTESLTVGGPSVGTIGFSRIIANTESLLAVAYKYYYYNLPEEHRRGFYYKDWLPPEGVDTTDTSVDPGGQAPRDTDRATKPAGKLLLGLHQKIFNLPVGFAVLMYDQQYTLFSAFYLEEAVIRAHQLQIATATVIEQGSFEFTRMVPFPEAEHINPFDHNAPSIIIPSGG